MQWVRIKTAYTAMIAALDDANAAALLRQVMAYGTDGTEINLPPVAAAFWAGIKADIDSDIAGYQKKVEAGRKYGRGRPKKEEDCGADDCGDRYAKVTLGYLSIPEDSKGKLTDKDIDKDIDIEKESKYTPAREQAQDEEKEDAQPTQDPPGKPAAHTRKKKDIVRKGYGEYGWVHLSDEEHARLLEDLGSEELQRCIQYIDESAEASGNKNKWKSWSVVIRRCSREGWGLKPWERRQPAPTSPQAPASPNYKIVTIDGREVAVKC